MVRISSSKGFDNSASKKDNINLLTLATMSPARLIRVAVFVVFMS